MTAPFGSVEPAVVLLDIEGTTTPIAFVHDVLFPYARARMLAFLASIWETPRGRAHARALVAEHRAELGVPDPPPPLEPAETLQPAAATSYALWLMNRDRKSPALKAIQGEIWERGYEASEIRGETFPDVPRAIRRWCAAGRRVAIYSSGSELAQRRLFATTSDGDLTPFIAAFFDTRVGAKTDIRSYARIANELGCAPQAIQFLSDVTAELQAAHDAGCRVTLVIRPGNAPQPFAGDFPRLASFDDLYFDTPMTS